MPEPELTINQNSVKTCSMSTVKNKMPTLPTNSIKIKNY